MFLEILQFVIFVASTYFIYVVLVQKTLYSQLKKQIPFVKPDHTNPISNMILGHSKSLNFQKDPMVFLKWRSECKSDIYGFNMSIMPRVVVFDPELITVIGTSKYTQDFVKSLEAQIVLKDVSNGLLMQEGAVHSKARNLFLPIFSIDNLVKMQPWFNKFSHDLVAKLKTVNPVNYEIAPAIAACTLDIISKVAFNYDMNSLKGGSDISNTFERLLVIHEFTPSLMLKFVFPLSAQLLSPFEFSHKKDLHEINSCIDSVIKERIAHPIKGNDILSKCLESVVGKPSKELLLELRGQIFTQMGAGHETTSTALSWAIYVLSQNLEIQLKLRKSVAYLPVDPSWDDIHSIKYLDNFTNELLRLYSPVSTTNRRATKAFTFKNYSFPKDTTFLIQLQALHLDEKLFPDPLSFNPDRWDQMPDSGNAYKFIPFWSGFRGCIGKHLALAEFKTILSIVIKDLEFSMAANHPAVERILRITQRPSKLLINITTLS